MNELVKGENEDPHRWGGGKKKENGPASQKIYLLEKGIGIPFNLLGPRSAMPTNFPANVQANLLPRKSARKFAGKSDGKIGQDIGRKITGGMN